MEYVLFAASAVVMTAYARYKRMITITYDVNYRGRCHCGGVEFQLLGPRHLIVWDCDCSICTMKKNWHFIIPEAYFKLIKGEENLTEYKFNTRTAKLDLFRVFR